MKKATEYDRFENLARGVLAVPHSEITERLEAEKQAKKRKKSRTSSASRVADDKD